MVKRLSPEISGLFTRIEYARNDIFSIEGDSSHANRLHDIFGVAFIPTPDGEPSDIRFMYFLRNDKFQRVWNRAMDKQGFSR